MSNGSEAFKSRDSRGIPYVGVEIVPNFDAEPFMDQFSRVKNTLFRPKSNLLA
jgi:hypothetical protein